MGIRPIFSHTKTNPALWFFVAQMHDFHAINTQPIFCYLITLLCGTKPIKTISTFIIINKCTKKKEKNSDVH